MKAQYALEYLMVIGIAMMIIVPAVYLFFSYSKSTAEEMAYPRVEEIGRKIIDNAASVYYSGEYSKVVIDVDVPDGVEDVYILRHRELVFNISTEEGINEMIFFSDIDLISTYESCLPSGCCDQVSNLCSGGGIDCEICYLSGLSPGQKKIKIESKGAQVNVSKVE